MSFSHNELCQLGAKWLRNSTLHNCKSVMIECGSFAERPDVIGFRYNQAPYGSVLLEAKTSRSDFFADRNKEHKQEGKGMGKWRYYICPEGVIQPSDLPPFWGLLHVSPKGRIKIIKGVFEKKKTYTEIKQGYEDYAFPVYDIETEHRLLAINLQGMMYNEAADVDYREIYKTHRKIQSELTDAVRNVERLERELDMMKQREAILLVREKKCTCGSTLALPRIRSVY